MTIRVYTLAVAAIVGTLSPALKAQAIRDLAGFRASAIPRNDDGSSSMVRLPFTVNFFGRIRDSVFVNNNGNITFDAPLRTFTPFGLERTQREIIAAFFADVDTRPGGSSLVTYGEDIVNGRRAFGVNYIDVGYFGNHDDKLNSFQLILIERSDTGASNFDIEFNYARILWETGDASNGVNGFGGVPAAVGWSNGSGDPGTSYEFDGSLVPGAFLDTGPRSLVRNRLNSTVPGRMVFRAREGMIDPGLMLTTGCPVPPANLGTRYTFQFSASGDKPPYRWTVLPDPGVTLPGLELSAGGSLSGAPNATGVFYFTVRVTATGEEGDVTVAKRCSITVHPPAARVLTACPLPAATEGAAYSQLLHASADSSPHHWSWIGPVVPGLIFTPDGLLSGVPSNAGTYRFLLRAVPQTAGAEPAAKECSIVVQPSPKTVTMTGCPTERATIGVPYFERLSAAGGTPRYGWILDGFLPPGLALTSSGEVTGVPSVAGAFPFTLRVHDGTGAESSLGCWITADTPRMSISTSCPLRSGKLGLPYELQLEAAGGSPPYSWTAAGRLPDGISVSPSGILSGNPSAAGAANFRLVVYDSQGLAAGKLCSLAVEQPPFSIGSCPLRSAVTGESYSRTLAAAGGVPPYVWSWSGTVPEGLVLLSGGRVEGMPRAAGSYAPTLTVADARGFTASQTCPIRVEPPALRITGCPVSAAILAEPYSTTVKANGGLPPYRWSLDGDLPAGLALLAEGVISGAPRVAGDYTFRLNVRDSEGRTASQSCSVAVGTPPLPAIRITGIPGIVEPARTDMLAVIELAEPYSLPIDGLLTLAVNAETGQMDSRTNQADPSLRFASGQRTGRFSVPAGSTRVSLRLASTGTVASTATMSIEWLRRGSERIAALPSPRIFRLPAAAPVITDACLATAAGATVVQLTGYTTTRELRRMELRAGEVTRSVDLNPPALEWFQNEQSIRTGGAFSLHLPLESGSPIPVSVSVSNAAGASTSRALTRCE
jgi:hypothetical protein